MENGKEVSQQRVDSVWRVTSWHAAQKPGCAVNVAFPDKGWLPAASRQGGGRTGRCGGASGLPTRNCPVSSATSPVMAVPGLVPPSHLCPTGAQALE